MFCGVMYTWDARPREVNVVMDYEPLDVPATSL